MELNSILEYERVILQCHDNPDPDAIGSAFALYRFLKERGKDAEIVYSGFSKIQKSNMILLIDKLGIPMRYIDRGADENAVGADEKTLLLTVDCQYGAGNVKKLLSENIAVIDHHVTEGVPPALSDIRPFLGSCSTLVWLLLDEAGFEFANHPDVCTALYYGLYTDTNSLAEVVHPLDRDLRDNIKYDAGLMKRLQNSNLSINDLTVAGKTLVTNWISKDTRSAVFEAEPCDPNILGFTSDIALQVDDIDVCVVFCRVSGGIKLSVRSCVREVMANELAARLCEGVGSGGGHKDKAGGFISENALADKDISPSQFLGARFSKYFSDYDLIYSGQPVLDLDTFKRCRKRDIPVGFACSANIFPEGSELVVRTLEGDTFITAGRDIYIMIGIRQEVWPIKRAKFEASYRVLDGPYMPDKRFLNQDRYEPTVKERVEGRSISILPFAKSCVPTGETAVLVKKLTRRTKVFTSWNREGYMFGDSGDYLAVREDDLNDVYVIEKDIFNATYSEV